MEPRKLIYLASPYRADDPRLVRIRYKLAVKTAAKIITRWGHHVFTPIGHSHPIAMDKAFNQENNTHSYWLSLDFKILDICDEIWLLTLPGYERSEGMQREQIYAREKGKPVFTVTPRLKLTKVKIDAKKAVL